MLGPGHFQGESTATVIAPAPLGRMGTRLIASPERYRRGRTPVRAEDRVRRNRSGVFALSHAGDREQPHKQSLRLAFAYAMDVPASSCPSIEVERRAFFAGLRQGARGLPRQIIRIAHYALSAAALDNARTVNADHLQHALEELRP